jgi:hypothetical protein
VGGVDEDQKHMATTDKSRKEKRRAADCRDTSPATYRGRLEARDAHEAAQGRKGGQHEDRQWRPVNLHVVPTGAGGRSPVLSASGVWGCCVGCPVGPMTCDVRRPCWSGVSCRFTVRTVPTYFELLLWDEIYLHL